MGCSINNAKNTISNMSQYWIRLMTMPLTRCYCTDLLFQNLCRLQARLYTDTLFTKVKPITRHECDHIYTNSEGFVCIVPLFSKSEVGMFLRDFAKQVGIPNESHFNITVEKTLQKNDLQCALQELFIKWRTLENFFPWQNCSKKVIGITKLKWYQSTLLVVFLVPATSAWGLSNHEVVVFQPCTLTTTHLGSVS